eukprot:TRINITY_DN5074_c0_g1_i3.p1 TRINITY_DN5074_c0_g1~~TRINITY_DN5074_c0_g1_i3.p1  ORF type:complete len:236 (+),score=34.04 TRINITY_DN5074_c0_g1_i3:53-760(+)
MDLLFNLIESLGIVKGAMDGIKTSAPTAKGAKSVFDRATDGETPTSYFRRPIPHRRETQQSPLEQISLSALWTTGCILCAIVPNYLNHAEIRRLYREFDLPSDPIPIDLLPAFWIGLFLVYAFAALFVWRIPGSGQMPWISLPVFYGLGLLTLLPDVLFGYQSIPGAVVVCLVVILLTAYLIVALLKRSLAACIGFLSVLLILIYLLIFLIELQSLNPKHPADNGAGPNVSLFPE